jgi:hypothetical protein
MAYFIFLKYLRSLEEFRKNPCVQIPLNLLVQISKALVYSKIQFLAEKNFSSTFDPIGLVASRPIQPFWPRAAKQAEPADQAAPLPLPPSLTELAAPPPHHGCRVAPLPRHGATPTDAPLLNSVACLYSVVNPPSSLHVTGAFMAGH